jgi:hypothetical protein
MAVIFTFQITAQPAGTYPFGPVTVPLNAVRATAIIDRVPLTNATLRINWLLELSQDAGGTWLPWGAAGTSGGSIINPKTGSPYTASSSTVLLPNPTNPNRRARGSVTINRTTTTTLTIDVV